MTTPMVWLFCRSRNLGPAIGVLVALSLTGGVIVHRSDDATVYLLLVEGLAAAAVGYSLGGPDPDWERSTPFRWLRWRAAHLLAGSGLGAVLVGFAAGHETAARNVFGLCGVAAMAAAFVGARCAWMPVFAYVLAASVIAGHVPARSVVAWPVASSNGLSWMTAVALLALGVGVYARRGPGRDVID